LDELKVEADADKLRRYKTYWLRHVTGGYSSRMAGTVLNGRGQLARPLKRLSGAAETGLSIKAGLLTDGDDDNNNNDNRVQQQACRGQPEFNALRKAQHATSIWNSRLKMTASSSFETKRRNIPEDGEPFTHCR